VSSIEYDADDPPPKDTWIDHYWGVLNRWAEWGISYARMLGLLTMVFLLYGAGAHAQDIFLGEGLVCDTPEQVERYILSTDTEATLVQINAEKAHSCALVDVAFYKGQVVKHVHNDEGMWAITHILVIGLVVGEDIQSVQPALQWTAFLTKDRGA
jgi:hypothetical protein